ncbi:winged helix-turn-helix transcriptional regulator [Nonomuraea sp. NPDC059023]|uniref:winged helix-turn-helix transcriptional regulator n=1 Tax=unclassified Nonomuraea TaxID=2593643 RepID=UPI0036C34B53
MTNTSADIAIMYTEQRMTIAQIAARLGISSTSVHRRLAARRIPRRPRGSTSSRLSPQRRQQILAAYRAGTPVDVISTELRTCGRTIVRVAAAAGEPVRGRGGRGRLDWDQIERLHLQGWPADAIALLVHASVRHTYQVLADLGYGRPRIELPTAAELAALYQRLGSVRAVAAELGIGFRRAREALTATRSGPRHGPILARRVLGH